jgi:hypothetical protein
MITANIASTSATVASWIISNIDLVTTSWNANAAVQDAAMSALRANITAANAAIVTANVGLKNYVDSQVTSTNANVSAANVAIATNSSSITVINANVLAANAAIVTANSSMKTYVDSAFTNLYTANLVLTSGAITGNAQTGALVIRNGGAGIAGNVNILGQLFVGAESQASTVGTAIAVMRGTSTTGAGVQYTQLGVINGTSSGSADFSAYSDSGDINGGWVDMGITGTTFDDPYYELTKPNDGYVLIQPISNSYGGNLVLSTSGVGSYNDIVFATGGFYSNAEVARFHGNTTTGVTFSVLGNIVNSHKITTETLTVTSAIQFANLTTTEVSGITSPTPGMTVYNYTTGNIQVYNGTKWANITLS